MQRTHLAAWCWLSCFRRNSARLGPTWKRSLSAASKMALTRPSSTSFLTFSRLMSMRGILSTLLSASQLRACRSRVGHWEQGAGWSATLAGWRGQPKRCDLHQSADGVRLHCFDAGDYMPRLFLIACERCCAAAAAPPFSAAATAAHLIPSYPQRPVEC